MKAATTKEVLIAARWIIENVGWCQNVFAKNKDGGDIWAPNQELAAVACVCVNGALTVVEATNEGLKNKAYNVLMSLTGEDGVAGWNDHPTRTKEQVLAVFDRAIKGQNE